MDGQLAECFRILTGGHNAVDDQQAVADEVVFAEDIPAAVEQLLSSISSGL